MATVNEVVIREVAVTKAGRVTPPSGALEFIISVTAFSYGGRSLLERASINGKAPADRQLAINCRLDVVDGLRKRSAQHP